MPPACLVNVDARHARHRSKNESMAAMAAMDADGSGEGDFDEFNKWWDQPGNEAAAPAGTIELARLNPGDVQRTGKKMTQILIRAESGRTFDLLAFKEDKEDNPQQVAPEGS